MDLWLPHGALIAVVKPPPVFLSCFRPIHFPFRLGELAGAEFSYRLHLSTPVSRANLHDDQKPTIPGNQEARWRKRIVSRVAATTRDGRQRTARVNTVR